MVAKSFETMMNGGDKSLPKAAKQWRPAVTLILLFFTASATMFSLRAISFSMSLFSKPVVAATLRLETAATAATTSYSSATTAETTQAATKVETKVTVSSPRTRSFMLL